MVAHEDVRVDRNVPLVHGVAQQLIEMPAIRIIDENGATVDATLRDMGRDPGEV